MSARRLGRLAGLVFVLAVVFGGVSVAPDIAAHGDAQSGAGSELVETVWV